MIGLTERQLEYLDYIKLYIKGWGRPPDMQHVATVFGVAHSTAIRAFHRMIERGALVRIAGHPGAYRLADGDDDLFAFPNDVRTMVLRESELLAQRPNMVLARIAREHYAKVKRDQGR